MKIQKKLASIAKNCVACGSCVEVCLKSALRIDRGIRAVVDTEKCVGCGQCAKVCPASVISMVTQEAV